MTGRPQFYEPRQYHWTKQPFSHSGLVDLAQQIFSGIRASTIGGKKVLVLDLDNTLWGGVVGEVGAHGIRFGHGADGAAFLCFQEHLKALTKRGVLYSEFGFTPCPSGDAETRSFQLGLPLEILRAHSSCKNTSAAANDLRLARNSVTMATNHLMRRNLHADPPSV
jgi:hypothetical protein